ncbi:MAG: hypothetical protein ABIH92_04855 [Nanoarchaeota archaeon]
MVERIAQAYRENKSEQQIKNIDYELNELVYKLYGITDKEKEIMEKSIRQ